MRFLVIALILLIQASAPLWAQTPDPDPDPSDSPGILQRLLDNARAAKDNVDRTTDIAVAFAREYYDEHIQPVVDDYRQWAAGVTTAAKEKILNFLPSFAANTTDLGAI